MASTRKIFLNSLSSKGSVSTGAQDIAALDADCPKMSTILAGFRCASQHQPAIGLEREPLVSVYY